MMTFGKVTLVGMLAMTWLVGCGGDDKKPPETAVTAPEPEPTATNTTPQSDSKDDDGSKGQLNISEEIRKACGITSTGAYFGFDSSNVQPEAQELFKKLAVCFSTGPLAKKQMRLVGHADPRGDEDYNMVLGGKRADSVKRAVAAAGLDSNQIVTTSRGEMDAVGTDETGWARDRRVDVALGD